MNLPCIKNLIDTNYVTVSILEDMQQVAEWLQRSDYFAVMDEELKITGIVTHKDVLHNPTHQVIDANIGKPTVTPAHCIFDVYHLMGSAQSDYLPVYLDNAFVGVITLKSITDTIIAYLRQLEKPGYPISANFARIISFN